MAEAYALKEGLMLAQRIGCNKLIIQSDCMEVVQIMQGGGFQRTLRLLFMMNATFCGVGFRRLQLSTAIGKIIRLLIL